MKAERPRWLQRRHIFLVWQYHVKHHLLRGKLRAQPGGAAAARPSFAYSLFVYSFHARRDRVVLLPPCSLYGVATLRPPTTRAGLWPDFALRLE